MNRQLVGSGITLAPNGVASDLFNITVPSGYNILTITLEPTQNYVVTGLAKHQSGYYYTVQNVYTGGDNSFDVYARVLFIKQ